MRPTAVRTASAAVRPETGRGAMRVAPRATEYAPIRPIAPRGQAPGPAHSSRAAPAPGAPDCDCAADSGCEQPSSRPSSQGIMPADGRTRRRAPMRDRELKLLLRLAPVAGELIELFEDLGRAGPIVVRRGAALLADDACAVDGERAGPVGPLGVDVHLEAHAIHRADRVRRVRQDGVREFVGPLRHRAERVPHAMRLVRIDGDARGAALAEFVDLVARLRKLAVADRSGVAVNEDEHYRLLAAELAEPHRSAQVHDQPQNRHAMQTGARQMPLPWLVTWTADGTPSTYAGTTRWPAGLASRRRAAGLRRRVP